MSQILKAIRTAIKASDKTRYRLWKETGIKQSHLSRLLKGEAGLSVQNVECLAKALGLRIVVDGAVKRKGR
jgi:DNA-binding phage protein